MADLFFSISLWFFSMLSTVLTILFKELVLKPHDFNSFKYSDCVSKSFGSTVPKQYATNFNGIFLVSLGSFCLKDPPAAFLGLANFLEIFLKSDLEI